MDRKRFGWFLILLLYMGTVSAQDLDEQERRWAVSGSWGGTWPVITKNTLSEKAAASGSMHTIMLEYYIPTTRFSLKGGYLSEEIRINPDISASLSNLEVGGRYYLLPQRFIVQPYGGLTTGWNLSPRRESGTVSSYYYNVAKHAYLKDYDCHYQIKEPLFTVAPVVGADIYILSCLAFTVEYNFRMGVGGKITGEVERRNSSEIGIVGSKGMRHNLSIGLKINFPFTLTQQDGNSILQWLDDVIFGN